MTHRRSPLTVLVALSALVVVALAACSAASTPTPSVSPVATPTPTSALPLTSAELKIRIWDRFGELWYCDPDYYPIARGDEIDRAKERWAQVTADPAVLAAITAHLGIQLGPGDPPDADRLAIYRAWKELNATALDPVGNGGFRFDFLAQPTSGASEGTRSGGTISAAGEIAIEHQVPAGQPMCPICLARGTRIETPGGPRRVEDLRLGDAIWTVGEGGARVPGVVIALGSTPVRTGHEVIRLSLSDGRSVTASPGHPLADGRRLRELVVGDNVGGSLVSRVQVLPYSGAETFDILASGPTGDYWSDGIALGSTLGP